MPGASISRKLDKHYLFVRNRFHFGWNSSEISGFAFVNPVLVPSLLQAARGLSEGEKGTGRVLFDITRELCEELAYMEYDTPSAHDFTRSDYHRASAFDGHELSVVPAPELLEASAPSEAGPDFAALCSAEIERSLRGISAADRREVDLSHDELVRSIDFLRTRRPTRLASMMSKLHAVEDYLRCLT